MVLFSMGRGGGKDSGSGSAIARLDVPDKFCRIDKLPSYTRIALIRLAAQKLGIDDPYFICHEGIAGATTTVAGRSLINFSSYNYLGLSGDSRVSDAVKAGIDRYGTSLAGAPRVIGEVALVRELETTIAGLYGVDDAVTFASGHATNVNTIGFLFGPKDLIVHDQLVHNSVIEGVRLSGATRRAFPHNDPAALDRLLSEIRGNFERVLVVIEGLYSMDGDLPALASFVEIKKRHRAFLMVDEAHSLGVLGRTGRGIHEHCGVPAGDIDIWMGTLSKSFAGCGGFIAGERALIDLVRYAAPAYNASVGLAPALAAASLTAIRIMLDEPWRLELLRVAGRYFLDQARQRGLRTGLSEGYCVVPLITGSSLKAVSLSKKLARAGINVQPIIHPAVEEKLARLRFFISHAHTPAQIDQTLEEISRYH